MTRETRTLTITYTVRHDSAPDRPHGFVETEVLSADVDGEPVPARFDPDMETLVYSLEVA